MTEESVFHEAVSRPASERLAYLDEVCANQPELRAGVEALLSAHERSDRLLDSPAQPLMTGNYTPRPVASPPIGTTDYRPNAAPGLVIAGRYTLEQKLGEGGMGEVWVVKQTEPVKRRVALKLIKAGMDSKAVLARFEQERQALALMDHPNIARVLDGGMTTTGQPFFVMELVNGLPLTKFCDEAKLGIRERLELFVPVCQAMQHAHQKGIVHRDLKPSNILVTLYDGRPVPKVIDFGVAKATSGRLTDESLSTQFGAVVGTFEYMSPEQTGFSALDVDTRADIYSLGVILYELLTGLRPIDAKRLKKTAYAELIRIIQEDEPSKPSTRLSTDEALPSLAAARHIEPKKLMALLRGELDWVVMKCLEKQRERRYETANGLARDIQRHLADEPVEARPPSVGYQLRKFVRRNRGQVIAACLVLLALLAGIAGTSWQAIRAEQARAEEADQRYAAEQAAAAEKAAKEQAVANFAIANDAVEKYLNAVTADADLKKSDFNKLRKKLMETAVPFYEKFVALRRDDPALEAARGKGYQRLALLRYEMGEQQASLADVERARDVFARLVADFPDVEEYRDQLALSHLNVARNLAAGGAQAKAAEAMAQATQEYARLAKAFPGKPAYRGRQGNSQNNEGVLFQRLGRYADAEAAYRKALVIREALVEEFPNVPLNRQGLGRTFNSLGDLGIVLGKLDEAARYHRRGLQLFEKNLADEPENQEHISDVARSHNNLAAALTEQGNDGEAIVLYRKGIALRGKQAERFPTVVGHRQELGGLYSNLALSLGALGRSAEAEATLRQLVELLRKLVADAPAVSEYRVDLGRASANLAGQLTILGRHAEAEAALRVAIADLERVTADSPDSAAWLADLGEAYAHFGQLLHFRREDDAALIWYAKAIETLETCRTNRPDYAKGRDHLLSASAGRAEVLDRLGRRAEALKDWDRALQLAEAAEARQYRCYRLLSAGQPAEAVKLAEEVAQVKDIRGGTLYSLARIYARATAKVDAGQQEQLAARAMELLRQSVEKDYDPTAQMKTDPAFATLRSRQDFPKLIQELEAKVKEREATKAAEQKPEKQP